MTTAEHPAGDDRLDLLVPAPWSRGRRLLVGLLAATLVAVLAVAWWAGVLGPRLEHSGAWGGSVSGPPSGPIEARREVVLHNPGLVPIEVRAFVAPDLHGIRWLDPEPTLPLSIPPGGERSVHVGFVADGCTVEGGGLTGFAFVARGGILPARTVEVTQPGGIPPPSWRSAEPSWVLDAISAVCTP